MENERFFQDKLLIVKTIFFIFFIAFISVRQLKRKAKETGREKGGAKWRTYEAFLSFARRDN